MKPSRHGLPTDFNIVGPIKAYSIKLGQTKGDMSGSLFANPPIYIGGVSFQSHYGTNPCKKWFLTIKKRNLPIVRIAV